MSLSIRLMIVLLVPIALCFGAYGYLNIRLRRQEMLAEAEREVRDHGTAIEVALDAFLRDRNLADMAELTENLSHPDRTLGVLIFDAEGHPVQASRSVERYRRDFDDIARRARQRRTVISEIRTLHGVSLHAFAFPIGSDGDVKPRGSAVVLRDMSYIEENLAQSAHRIVLAGTAVALVVILGTWLGVRAAVLRPIATLVQGVERVAEGALDVEVHIPRHDELGRMATAFNRMMASLRAARQELEAKSKANVALERRLHHAQRLALIGQLAANLAHQIGSPLNVILGRARYALKQGGQSPRDARHFQEIIAGAESISRVVEQLLSQARRVRGRPGKVDLGQLARQTVRFLEAECERASVITSVQSQSDVVIDGSRDELEQVILNLCLNAIQAQPCGGRLDIFVGVTQGSDGRPMAELSVKDTGPGVPPELRERIFEPFFTTKDASVGTGLGLAICEEIVRRHGGTITVTDAPGGGALFRVTLPMHATAPASIQQTES